MRNSINDDDSFDCRLLKHLPAGSYIDLEDSEEEEEEEANLEMVCPYCSEGFDALELCVHLEDRHTLEIKLGVCPLCASNLGKNMISHLIIQHESLLKGLCKKKLHDDESFSIISLLRKKMQEHSRTLQKETTTVTSSTSSATDPLLFSFVYNSTHESQADSSAETSSSKILTKSTETLESDSYGDIPADLFTSEDHEEKALKSDFIQKILLSTIITDTL